MELKKFKCIFFALLAVFFCGKALAEAPARPLTKSELGYLTAEVPTIELKPRYKKIFIAPQSELAVLEDAPEHFIFLLDRKTDSYYCKILKINRYTMMMNYLDRSRKKIYFRGGIEAETLPITIEKDEELPIKENLRDGRIVLLKRKGFIFPAFISNDKKGFAFSKLSRFDVFEKEQNQKGLVHHRGKWIPKKEFERECKKRKIKAENDERIWKNLRRSASKGFITLKNGKTLPGRIKGINGKKILFSSSGKEIWVGIEDVADMPLNKTLAKGRLNNAKTALEKLDKALEKNELGNAAFLAENSLDELEQISHETPEEYEEALQLLSQTAAKIKTVYDALDKTSCAIYCHNVFPRDELNFHLVRNHVLFKNKIWLEKKQICRKCKGEGKVDCPVCKGLGKIVRNCDKCKNGLVKCHICKGEGEKICPRCNGFGSLTKKCKKCGGSGYIWEIRTPPAVASPGMTVIRDGKVIFRKPTVIYKPTTPYGRYVQVICSACYGNGTIDYVCKRCRGKGKVPCPRFEKCPVCRGLGHISKICENCNGTKKLECNICKGKGFTGKPQEYRKGEK